MEKIIKGSELATMRINQQLKMLIIALLIALSLVSTSPNSSREQIQPSELAASF